MASGSESETDENDSGNEAKKLVQHGNNSSVKNASGKPKNSRCPCSHKCQILSAIVVVSTTVLLITAVVFVVLAVVVGHAFVESMGTKFETVHDEVGGNVPVELSSDFDSHKVDKVKLNLTNITKSEHPAIVHYGNCDDVKNKSVAVRQSFNFNVTEVSLKPQQVNNDTSMYALAGSSLSYKIQVSTDHFNSSEKECVSLFVFNTFVSYQMFLKDKNGGQYFNESVCVNKTGLSASTAHTVNLEKDTFLFAAITTNASANISSLMSVNVTIDGLLREHNVSLLKNKTVKNDDYSVDLCETASWCNFGLSGKTKCVFVQSAVHANISFLPNRVYLSVNDLEMQKIAWRYGTVLGVTFIVAIVVITVSVLVYKYFAKKLKGGPEPIRRNLTTAELESDQNGTSNVSHTAAQGSSACTDQPTNENRTDETSRRHGIYSTSDVQEENYQQS